MKMIAGIGTFLFFGNTQQQEQQIIIPIIFPSQPPSESTPNISMVSSPTFYPTQSSSSSLSITTLRRSSHISWTLIVSFSLVTLAVLLMFVDKLQKQRKLTLLERQQLQEMKEEDLLVTVIK